VEVEVLMSMVVGSVIVVGMVGEAPEVVGVGGGVTVVSVVSVVVVEAASMGGGERAAGE
jgi:hypothetical protein